MKTRAIILLFAVIVARGLAADTTLQQAYEAQAAGRQEDAIKLFLQHLDKRPGDATASLEAAEICASRGEHEKAAMLLTRAVAANPADEQLSYRLAAQEAFAKRTKDAKWRFGVLTKSSDRQLASMAQASLDALEKSEQREIEAKKSTASPKWAAVDVRRQAEFRRREQLLAKQQNVYDLIRAKDDQAVIAAVDDLFMRGEATPALRMEQVYALQREGQEQRALEILESLPDAKSGDIGLMRATLLLKLGRTGEAYEGFRAVQDAGPDSLEGRRAAAQIAALPPAANLDRWFWGEMDVYGTYLGRYGIGVAAGRIRQGAYVPGARWLEPFVQADFSLDSSSSVGEGITTIYNENLAGFHAGARIRPFASQSFTFYFLGGFANNLIDNPNYQSGWFGEVIAGVNGYWGFGPGTGWDGINETPQFAMGEPAPPRTPLPNAWTPNAWVPARTRFDWFVEGGGDWAYYSRLSDFIAYSQGKGGWRVLQFGRAAAVDVYGFANLVFDAVGNYYDNYFEGGPGIRVVTVPVGAATVTTSLEYATGAYLGPNYNNTRGSTGASYNDVRVSVAMSLRW
jgi:tetratricopeptide (TPR) repeat protein